MHDQHESKQPTALTPHEERVVARVRDEIAAGMTYRGALRRLDVQDRNIFRSLIRGPRIGLLQEGTRRRLLELLGNRQTKRIGEIVEQALEEAVARNKGTERGKMYFDHLTDAEIDDLGKAFDKIFPS